MFYILAIFASLAICFGWEYISNKIPKRRKFVHRDFEGDIIPKEVYDTLDFKKCCVAGRYALRQFEKKNWQSNDIDIFIDSTPFKSDGGLELNSLEAFKVQVNQFIQR